MPAPEFGEYREKNVCYHPPCFCYDHHGALRKVHTQPLQQKACLIFLVFVEGPAKKMDRTEQSRRFPCPGMYSLTGSSSLSAGKYGMSVFVNFLKRGRKGPWARICHAG